MMRERTQKTGHPNASVCEGQQYWELCREDLTGLHSLEGLPGEGSPDLDLYRLHTEQMMCSTHRELKPKKKILFGLVECPNENSSLSHTE
jgi:hypothetical protein